MIAERDIAIPPRGDSHSQGKGRGRTGGFSPFGRKPVRRGEKEAHNLLWRRRYKMVGRVCTLLLMAGTAAICLEAWRGGAMNLMGGEMHARLDRMEVKAGLTVDEIRIKGQNRTPLAEIRAALGLSPRQSILAVNIDEARQRVEQLTWVKQASVSRQLPNAIDVHIVERTPFALWQDNGHLWLIDAEGAKLTDRNLDEFSQLPQVVGDGAPEKAAPLLALLKSNPYLFGRVKAAVRVSNRRWDLVMKNGVRVRLPDENETEAYARLAAFQKDQQILERNIALIDLRFSDRLVVAMENDADAASLKTSAEKGPAPAVAGPAAKDGPEVKGEADVKGDLARPGIAPARHRGREI